MYRGAGRAQVAWDSALLYDMIYTQPVLYEFGALRMPVLLWTELVQGGFGTESWSKDGVYVYDLLAFPMSAVVRIRISDHKSEQVVDLKNFTTAGANWLALTPDDSPVLLRDTGTQDVYALDWTTEP